jgi:hypothetical protein
MRLLESRQTRRERKRLEAEQARVRRKTAIRKGKQDLQCFISHCDQMGVEYRDMAKQALTCGNEPQCDEFLLKQNRLESQARAFRSILLTLRDVENQGRMATAIKGAADAVGAMSQEMSVDLQGMDMDKLVAEVNLNLTRLETTEGQMIGLMDHLNESAKTTDIAVSAPLKTEVPQHLRETIARRKADLLDEIRLSTRLGDGSEAVVGDDVDARIREGLKQVSRLRDKG